MKTVVKLTLLMFLVLMVGVACSQKSGTDEQAAAPEQGQVMPAAPNPMQPSAEQPAQGPMTQEQAKGMAQGQPQANAAPSGQAGAQLEEISGTVVRTEDGIAIFSDSGSYMIAGQELDDLVGKNVKVTGTIEEGGEKPIITVQSVSLIE